MSCGYILAIVFVNYFVLNEAKDFCHSFQEHGFKVDFGYQNVILKTIGRLYIGSDYWKVSDGESFERHQNYSSDWIPKNRQIYSILFNVDINSVNIRGMWRKNEDIIEWKGSTKIEDNVLDTSDFEPSFSFIYTESDYKVFHCFGEQTHMSGEQNEFRRRYECYYFQPINGRMNVMDVNGIVEKLLKGESQQSDGIDYKNNSLNGVIGTHRIITMFRSKDIRTDIWRLVIIYQIDKTIYYCMTEFQLFADECKDIKELVDCSDNTLQIIVFSSMAIIVVIIVILLSLLCVKMLTKTKGKPQLKAETNRKTIPSALEESVSELSSSGSAIEPSNAGIQSQIFSVQSDVDYTKPIPLKPNSSSSEASVLKA